MQSDGIFPEVILDDFENEPLDMLDQDRTRSEIIPDADSDDKPEFDSEARLIVHVGGKPKKRSSHDALLDLKSEAGSCMSINKKNEAVKRRKTSNSGWSYAGTDYPNKKAAGDIQKKGKFDPYPCWPLDRKLMSRKLEHHAAARKGITSVVKLTKRLEATFLS